MSDNLRSLFLCFVCLFALVPAAEALPLINGQSGAVVELVPEQPQLAEKLRARLNAYAGAHTDADAASEQRHIRAESLIIKKQLRAEGYYEATIQLLRPRHYRVSTGPRTTIRQWSIQSIGTNAVTWPSLPLQRGQPLLAREVLAARNQLLAFLRKRCHPQARVEYRVVLGADERETSELQAQEFGAHALEGTVTYTATPGPAVHIGAVEFQGIEQLHAQFLQNLVDLEPGKCLRYTDLDRARLALLQTGLLNSVAYDVDIAASEQDVDSTPATVRFRVSERKSRSLKASIGYTTDTREGATLGWEQRNLFGSAERLQLEGGVDQINRKVAATLTLPQFFHARQELQLLAHVDSEKPDAYTSRRRELAAILSRDWRGGRRASVGVAFTESRIEEEKDGEVEAERFSLVSLPLALGLDRRDDPLNPRTGWMAELTLRPFTDLSQESLDFLQSAVTLSGYLSQDEWLWRPTVALRAAVGSLTGASLTNIPADQRFYVGGGGSVRGYPYQSVGELTDGDADGGKSFAETSLELRLHFSQDWGAVLFADGGYAYSQELPSFGEQFLWGAGVGLRYFTRFAPLRFDLAFPLDRRDGVDNSFQVYISFGQAF